MGQFYYTVSSLPTLMYDEPVSLKVLDYLEDCFKWLKDDEKNLLSSAVINPDPEVPLQGIAEQYRRWEVSLRNDLVSLRAAAMGLEAEGFKKEGEIVPDTAALAAGAFKQESPLLAEEVLNKGRWEFIESMKSGHFFDLEYLILYSLQLQILERKSCFEEEAGFTRYKQIYQNILNQMDDDSRGDQE